MEYFDPRGGSNRYNIKTDFFRKWSNEMAYVLGFLYADGNVVDAAKSARTQYIKFSSKDKDILITIKKILQSDHPIYYRSPHKILFKDGKTYESSELFYLRIGSRKMFADLKKIGLVPNKSKIIRFPTTIPNKYLGQFIRGYFDGDGCIHLKTTRGKKQRVIIKRFNTIFTSGSRLFLERLNSVINKITKISKKKVYYNHRAYQLRYSTLDSIKLFKFLYKDTPQDVYLKRKFKIFVRYFQLYPSKIDKDIENILMGLKTAWYPSS